MLNAPSPQAPEPLKVQKLFDRLSGRYDFFNRLVSVSLDKNWRMELVKAASQSSHPHIILDIGTGTGSLVFSFLKFPGSSFEQSSFLGLDLSYSMLKKAGKKISGIASDQNRNFYLLQGNSGSIPLISNSVDVVVSAFVLRNVKKIVDDVLREVHRVLKPGGSLFLLDLSLSRNSIIQSLQKIYLKTVVPAVGMAVFGKDWSGDYLSETISNFGTPDQFSDLLRRSGFRDIQFKNLSGGITVLHSARKVN